MIQAGDIVISEHHLGSLRSRPYYAVVTRIEDGMVFGCYSYTPEEAERLYRLYGPNKSASEGCLEMQNVRVWRHATPMKAKATMNGRMADIYIFE